MDSLDAQCQQASSTFYAHSRNAEGAGVAELLSTHINAVCERAVRFAAAFGAQEQARAAGLLHDLGKYADQFQRRLSDPRERGRDHSSLGARFAACAYQALGVVPALAIEGHHTGLTQIEPWKDLADRIRRRMEQQPDDFTSVDADELFRRFRADGYDMPAVTEGLLPAELAGADMLDVRMLFSCLVDADFLATEEHFEGDAATPRQPRPEGPTLDARRALAVVQERIESLRRQPGTDPRIRNMRDRLAQACVRAAERPQGIFTLSAPTGAGKTLAMLLFGLRHALRHGLRRIVLVMPFLNIIDQTAAIYRSLFNRQHGFPDHFVIEDHSNVQPPGRSDVPDLEDQAYRPGRLLAENWDAPIILTTSVQCLESLMADRPAACRKLHRLANSVILFDEVQTLPPHLALPTLATLSRLCERFGATVVFATATQPAFDHLDTKVQEFAGGGWKPHEIAADIQKEQFEVAARRVRVKWRIDHPIPWESLADELTAEHQVLCIVNLKRHAKTLAELVDRRQSPALFHLSTNMCPAHRTDVLNCVRRSLMAGRSVQLIATQCVEAGVDLDFPVVYRALGPLEAIAQAAGRCNRHGGRPLPGLVRVFVPQDEGRRLYPPGAYEQAAASTLTFLRGLADSEGSLDELEVLNDPPRLRCYFRQFYALTRAANMRGEMKNALEMCDFGKVAGQYRLIEGDTINIMVPYEPTVFEALRAEAWSDQGFGSIEAIRDWIRRARPHTVSVYRPKSKEAIWAHLRPVQFSRRRYVDNDEADWFIALPGLRYSKMLGIEEPEDASVV